MKTAAIRKRLSDYMQTADEKKVKAIYAMVEDEINTAENDWDEEFIRELNRRSKEMASGKSKTYTWEEVKKNAAERLKAKNAR